MADSKQTAPCGTWASPITAELMVAGTVGLGQTAIDGEILYWIELRPGEQGRSVVVARDPEGSIRDLTPAGFNVRSRVHEYGGGAFTVAAGVIYFSNDGDRRLYRQAPGEAPEPLTPAGPWRYADIVVDPRRGRLICVREDHGVEGEARNEIVTIDLAAPSSGSVVATGADFYAAPRLSPDGRELAFLCWDHPNMPWDGTELRLAAIGEDGELGPAARVAGGPKEAIFQPEWSAQGVLHLVSDRSGFWNLYRLAGAELEPVVQMQAELGKPLWMFGETTYGFASGARIVFAHAHGGTWQLSVLTAGGEIEPLELPATEIDWLSVAGDRAVFIAGRPTAPSAVVAVELSTGAHQELRSSSSLEIDRGYLSRPEPIRFSTGDPGGDSVVAHALYYPPANRDFVAPEGEAPPLVVMSHGGPTSATTTALRWGIQFWTSRGFAVVDVNYRGSTGYGRAYREALAGRWGIADVEDCVAAARYLADRGLADPSRVAIRGGSAGGYTTLQALATSDAFAAGASLYGVSDLEALAQHTHKFESRYLDSLIAPYPEQAEIYRDRSPIHHTDALSAPVIFLQGLEDRVVPPEQSERMADALRAKGIPVAYVPFEGEQHGFRRGENIRRAVEAELDFYARIFGFEPADAIEAVEIDNL